MTTLNQSSLLFISANVWESVTLQCHCQDNVVIFFWYKQTLGQKPKLMSSFYKHNSNGTSLDEFDNNPRFSLDTRNKTNKLRISH